jgi:hypothetical protein
MQLVAPLINAAVGLTRRARPADPRGAPVPRRPLRQAVGVIGCSAYLCLPAGKA